MPSSIARGTLALCVYAMLCSGCSSTESSSRKHLDRVFANNWIGETPVKESYAAYIKGGQDRFRNETFWTLALDMDMVRRVHNLGYSQLLEILGDPDLWWEAPNGRVTFIYNFDGQKFGKKHQVMIHLTSQGVVESWGYNEEGANDFSHYYKWK
jgi:hypothetical protein